jgi:hypothetical protein
MVEQKDYQSQFDNDPQRVVEELQTFLHDATVGSVKFAAFSDFVDLRDTEDSLAQRRKDLIHAQTMSRLDSMRKTKLQLTESDLRLAEASFVAIQININRDSSRVPGYHEVFHKINELGTRVREAFVAECTLSDPSSYGRAKLSQHLHSLRSDVYKRQ